MNTYDEQNKIEKTFHEKGLYPLIRYASTKTCVYVSANETELHNSVENIMRSMNYLLERIEKLDFNGIGQFSAIYVFRKL